jgi:hypothetical protein
VATPQPTSARVKLDVTAGAGGPGGTYFVIERSVDGGTTWVAVRGASNTAPNLAYGATATIYDYEAMPATALLYRVRTVLVSGNNVIPSANSATAGTTLTLTTWWVKDVNNPALNMSLCDAQQNVRNRKGDSTPIYPAGRKNPIVLRGPVHGADSSFRTVVQTEADRTAVLTLFTVQETVLIQDPRGRQWYAEWIGDLTDSQFRDNQPHYAIERKWVEVDVPS